MFRKILIIIVVLFVLGSLGYMGRKIYNKWDTYKNLIVDSPLPEFTFITLEGDTFRNDDLEKQTPAIFIFFSPKCSKCQTEAQELSDNIDLFKSTQIIFVSPFNKDTIEKFMYAFELEKHAQIKVLRDPLDRFYEIFGSNMFPSIYIYNKDHEFVDYFKGGVEIEELHDIIAKLN